MRAAAAQRRQDLADHAVNVVPALPALALMLIAVNLHYTADFGLAYRGGVEAWATGYPQRVVTFSQTPFVALAMALVSRAAPEFVAARTYMALNLALWMMLLFVVWSRLRPHVPSGWWWATLAGAALFAPAVSTIFWLQFNLLVFVLALGGFVLIGRHDRLAGLLIGVSLALKPVVILLPLVLLLRRRSRAAGAWSIVTAAGLTMLSFGFLAWRAQDLAALNPIAYLRGFVTKGESDIVGCVAENYAPAAMLCRLGLHAYTEITVIVAATLVVLLWLMTRNLPDTSEGNWEVFAAACFLSMMFGPIDWAHYGLLMGPLYLLLAYQFWRYGAPPFLWAGFAVSFLLVELVWDPLSSLAGASIPLEIFVYTAGQFGQYFLLLTWVRWRTLRRSPAVRSAALRIGRP